jgi:hypothetical protein
MTQITYEVKQTLIKLSLHTYSPDGVSAHSKNSGEISQHSLTNSVSTAHIDYRPSMHSLHITSLPGLPSLSLGLSESPSCPRLLPLSLSIVLLSWNICPTSSLCFFLLCRPRWWGKSCFLSVSLAIVPRCWRH